ncbi:MAG: hypothetical protein ACRD0V_19055, partial [Acidimicrobiales bacterium]
MTSSTAAAGLVTGRVRGNRASGRAGSPSGSSGRPRFRLARLARIGQVRLGRRQPTGDQRIDVVDVARDANVDEADHLD